MNLFIPEKILALSMMKNVIILTYYLPSVTTFESVRIDLPIVDESLKESFIRILLNEKILKLTKNLFNVHRTLATYSLSTYNSSFVDINEYALEHKSTIQLENLRNKLHPSGRSSSNTISDSLEVLCSDNIASILCHRLITKCAIHDMVNGLTQNIMDSMSIIPDKHEYRNNERAKLLHFLTLVNTYIASYGPVDRKILLEYLLSKIPDSIHIIMKKLNLLIQIGLLIDDSNTIYIPDSI
jgi:hypothetical protein